ncbi:MAG: T9SS type A sorting domain-containing protein [Flavobacteriales bacterium]|nr:MAG: T9SS type A sorting domain-containing protein [Flavobacteriales bacterium]
MPPLRRFRPGLLRAAMAVAGVFAAVVAWSQSAGDYGSWASGAWNTAATWRVYDGSSWATSPAAASAPGATNNVYIRTGTTVTAAFGSQYYCQNLFVEAGGRLYNNNTGGTNLSYVHVLGTAPGYTGQIVCDGQIGNGATLDGISLSIDGANVTLSGTGTVDVARIRKTLTAHPTTLAALTTTNFTIARNVNLRFSSGTTTMLYNGAGAACNFNVTINAGSTVTLVGVGTGNVSMDGLAGSDAAQLGGTITVNGTLIIPGIYYATTNNASATYVCRLEINNGGLVRVSQISAGPSGTAWHRMIVNAGGTLEITGTPTAWPAYSTTNNQFQFVNSSQTIYPALGSQDIRNVNGGYGNLRIQGSGVKQILGTLLVKGDLEILNTTGSPELDVSVSNFQVTVWGNWTNYGPAGFNERTGLVLFGNGSTVPQTITTGGTGEQFFNWRIHKTTAQPLVTMGSPVQVLSNLELGAAVNFFGAILDLNGHQLTMYNPAAGAISTASGSFGTTRHIRSERTDNSSRVRWDIGTTAGPHLVPFGTSAAYIPFTFDLLNGDAGSVTMATYGTPPDNQPLPTTPTLVTVLPSYLGYIQPDNSPATVDRFWQIDPTGSPMAKLTFTYAPTELPAAPFDNPLSMRAQRWNSTVPYWEEQLEGTAAAYWADADTVTGFGPFTLTNIISPLPVELLRFTAWPEGDAVQLAWTTASELNNAHFTVLRSRDGHTYEPVTRVAGAGNSQVVRDYHAKDPAPWDGLSYYKLRQTDFDGTWTESDAVPIRFGTTAAPVIYPNPARNLAQLAGLPVDWQEVRIVDASGRVAVSLSRSGDTDRLELPVSGLAPGAYAVLIQGSGSGHALRLVKE